MGDGFRLKHRHFAMLRSAGVRLDPLNRAQQKATFQQKLRDGVYSSDNTVKRWVTKKGNECIALYAKKLSITGSDDPTCWKWYSDEVEKNVNVAESAQVRWLQVQARLSTIELQQNTEYKASFKVKVTNPDMVNTPLTVRLALPDGSIRENPGAVKALNSWENLDAGTFRTSSRNVGTLEISLQQLDASLKKGVVIKCVEIVASS